jgi:hypothetical protein
LYLDYQIRHLRQPQVLSIRILHARSYLRRQAASRFKITIDPPSEKSLMEKDQYEKVLNTKAPADNRQSSQVSKKRHVNIQHSIGLANAIRADNKKTDAYSEENSAMKKHARMLAIRFRPTLVLPPSPSLPPPPTHKLSIAMMVLGVLACVVGFALCAAYGLGAPLCYVGFGLLLGGTGSSLFGIRRHSNHNNAHDAAVSAVRMQAAAHATIVAAARAAHAVAVQSHERQCREARAAPPVVVVPPSLTPAQLVAARRQSMTPALQTVVATESNTPKQADSKKNAR